MYKALGAVCRRLRKAQQLSMEDLAGKMGYPPGGDPSGIQRLEQGEKRCYLDLYQQVAKALGVPLFRLIQEAEDPDPAQPLLSAPEEASVRRYLELPDEARAHVDAVIAAFAGERRR